MAESSARNWRRRILLPGLIPAFVLLAWVWVARTECIPGYLFPPPEEIGRAALDYLFGGTGEGPYAGRFLRDAWSSLFRVGCGFLIAAGLGVPLGVLSGRVATARRLMGSTINGLRAVPGISWLPLAMVWFGIGMRTTVFLVALAAFFPVYLNAAAGARQVNPLLLQAGAMMGVRRLRGTFSILLPAAMPHIVTGLRLGLGISWAYLVLGELTGVPDGLGAVIMDARMLGRIDIIVVGMILIAVMGRASDLLLTSTLRLCFMSVRRMQ